MPEFDKETPYIQEMCRRAVSPEEVDPTLVGVEKKGNMILARRRGAYIAECVVRPAEFARPAPILHSALRELRIGDLAASHMASPVGESFGNPIDGPAKWADWRVLPGFTDLEDDAYRIYLQAERSDLGPSYERQFGLMPFSAEISSRVRNNSAEPLPTSLGECLYFDLGKGEVDNFLINRRPVKEYFSPQEVADFQWGGEVFIEAIDYLKEVILQFPDGRVMGVWADAGSYPIEATVLDDEMRQIGAHDSLSSELKTLFSYDWKNKLICMKIVVGCDGNGGNKGVMVPPYGVLSINTAVEYIPPQSPDDPTKEPLPIVEDHRAA